MTIDMYRITMFKSKIKALIPGGEHIRFWSSRDRSHIGIDLWRYTDREGIAELVCRHLKRGKIEHKLVKDCFGFYSDRPENEWPADYVSIPIDQEALPERKR